MEIDELPMRIGPTYKTGNTNHAVVWCKHDSVNVTVIELHMSVNHDNGFTFF